MSYPWKNKGRYDCSEFELDHLVDYRGIYKSPDGSRTFQVLFKFHFHCFTDHKNVVGDHRIAFNDPNFPGEGRVFCPHRWWLSQRLPQIFGTAINGKRLLYAGGLQWVYNHRMIGVSSPYAIYMKFSTGAPGGQIVVNVNSAYTKADFQKSGDDMRFDLLLAEASEGRIPGADIEAKKAKNRATKR